MVQREGSRSHFPGGGHHVTPPGTNAPWAGPGARTVFLAVLLLLLASLKAVHEFGDDVSMFQVTLSLLEGGVSVPAGTPGSTVGLNGKTYSQYGPGVSIIALPFAALGRLLAHVTPDPPIRRADGFPSASTEILVTMLAPAFATAASAALLFLASALLGLGRLPALFVGLGLVFCTPVWHFGRTFMSEPFSLLVFSAFAYACAAAAQGRTLRLGWLTLAVVGLPLLRPGSAVFLPLLVAVVGAAQLEGGTSRSAVTRTTAILTAASAAGVALVAYYNVLRFGSVFETGYRGAGTAFTTPFLTGLKGFLVSPGKGVFLYAPVALLAVLGMPALWRRSRSMALLVGGLFLAHLLLYSRYAFWWGGGSWGPRFLVPALGGVMLASGCWLEEGSSRFRGLTSVFVSAWSVLVQVACVYVSTVPYEAQMEATPELFQRLLWDWPSSPVWAQIRYFLFTAAPPDLAFRHYGWRILSLVQASALAGLAAVLWRGVVRPAGENRR